MKTETNSPLKGRRLLVAASGSIAAVKTPLLVSNLIKAGAEVRCLITPSAAKLVSPTALASLSRHRCYQDEDQWSSREPRPLHIALAEWAEIVIIAPLTASTLSRWSYGLGEGLLASMLLACEKPVIAAAAMNTAMWSNEAVRMNWEKLVNQPKVLPLSPCSGLLACDRIGEGRMADPELIELAIKSALIQIHKNGEFKRDLAGIRLLVTAGPTLEALDQARVITNRSSGRMGVFLAQAARMRGAKVELVHGPLQLPETWLEGLNAHPVSNSEEMRTALTELQSNVDVIAMTAAVADFKKKGSHEKTKLSKKSLLNSLENGLETTPDLLSELGKNRHKDQVLLGFSALTGKDEEIQKIGEAKRINKACDLLMANPIDRKGQGFESNSNGGFLLGPGGMVRAFPVTSKLDLAHDLLDAVLEIRSNIYEVK